MTGQSKISVMGLYNWDNTLFSLMQIPEGMNLDTVTDNILAETAELEVLYPNPDVLKTLIGVWSHKMVNVWTELYKTTLYEYNPIENYNRITEGSKDSSITSQHSGTDTTADTSRLGGSDTSSRTGNIHEEGSVAGFDSVPSGNNDGLVNNDKNSTMTSESGSTTYGKTDTRNGSLQYGHRIADNEETETYEHSHGNIGVTTTQKLIREQREVAEFNVYDRIIKDFMDRFCIMVF